MHPPEKPPTVFLNGERLYLRPLELSDLDRYVRWLNDEEVRAWVTFYLPLTEKSEREFIENAGSKPDQVALAIVLKDGNRHIGGTGLFDIRWKDRAAMFGILIGERDCRDQGYGTEATRLMLRYAFTTLNLNRVELGVFDFNERAIRVYEQCGFVREGVRREWAFKDGRYVDEILYAMLAREYFGGR